MEIEMETHTKRLKQRGREGGRKRTRERQRHTQRQTETERVRELQYSRLLPESPQGSGGLLARARSPSPGGERCKRPGGGRLGNTRQPALPAHAPFWPPPPARQCRRGAVPGSKA